MYTKLEITGDILVQTGFHIGANDAFSAIGAIDSPVVRDSYTGHPVIPGSSLKGKMRLLLSRALSDELLVDKPQKDPEPVLQLFGSNTGGGEDGSHAIKAHLIFTDAPLINPEDFENRPMTEAKFENTIDRLTGVANPRQIERVVPGARFGLRLIYDVDDLSRLEEDFKNIALALELLTYDYLGGHGTRGSGQVAFENLQVRSVLDHDSITDQVLEALNAHLNQKVASHENPL